MEAAVSWQNQEELWFPQWVKVLAPQSAGEALVTVLSAFAALLHDVNRLPTKINPREHIFYLPAACSQTLSSLSHFLSFTQAAKPHKLTHTDIIWTLKINPSLPTDVLSCRVTDFYDAVNTWHCGFCFVFYSGKREEEDLLYHFMSFSPFFSCLSNM